MNDKDIKHDETRRRSRRLAIWRAMTKWPPTCGQVLIWSLLLNAVLGFALIAALGASMAGDSMTQDELRQKSGQYEQMKAQPQQKTGFFSDFSSK